MGQKNFFKTVGGDVHVYNTIPDCSGKKMESQNVRMDDDLKKWVNDIACAVSESKRDSKYGASSVIREAIIFFKEFYHVKNKLFKNKSAIIALLEKL